MTRPPDDSARLAVALRSAAEDARPREDCPASDRIWDAARQESPLDDRLAILDHCTTCPVCAEAWRLAAELGGGAGTPAVHARAHLPSALGRRGIVPLLLAASLVAAVGLAFVFRAPGPADPVLRDPGAGTLTTPLEPGVVLPRDDFRLRWDPGPPGSRYDLTVSTEGLEVIAQVRGIEAPEYTVPPERLAGLPQGTRVLWRVVAHIPDGPPVSSRTFEVSVP